MSRRLFRLLAACATLHCLSCSGGTSHEDNPSGGGSGAAGTGGSAAGAAQSGGFTSGGTSSPGAVVDFATAFCGAARSCCDKDGIDATGLTDCEAEAERQFDVLEAVKNGTVVANSSLGACVDQLAALADSCVLDATTLPACGTAFSGTVEMGDECVTVLDCKRDDAPIACIKLQSSVQPAAMKGVCRSLSSAALGDACLVTVSAHPYGITYGTTAADPPLTYCDAAAGLYCSLETATCVRLGASGAACKESHACQPGLACVDSACQKAKQLGESCTTSTECLAPLRCTDAKCGTPRFASKSLCDGDLN